MIGGTFIVMIIDGIFIVVYPNGCQDYHYIQVRTMYAKNVCDVNPRNRVSPRVKMASMKAKYE